MNPFVSEEEGWVLLFLLFQKPWFGALCSHWLCLSLFRGSVLERWQKPRNPRNLDGPIIPVLCNSPKFPEELKPICQKPNAEEILERLETIAQDPSTCEICAYAACAGC